MESLYHFEKIVLIESMMKRFPDGSDDVDTKSLPLIPKINLSKTEQFTEDKTRVRVDLTTELLVESNNITIFKVRVVMGGQFRIEHSANSLPIDDFININAPAIIFPFIREHIANLSIKSLLPAILLPPINFVELNADNWKMGDEEE